MVASGATTLVRGSTRSAETAAVDIPIVGDHDKRWKAIEAMSNGKRLQLWFPKQSSRKLLNHVCNLLLLLVCGSVQSQVVNTSVGIIKSFHDDTLDVTYFFPSQFVPVAPSPVKARAAGIANCQHPILTANSDTPVDISSFVITAIDGTCPDLLASAIQLSPFTRGEVLRQLKQYGEPSILLESMHYTIDHHPGAFVLASVSVSSPSSGSSETIYAAKACALGEAQDKRRKKSEPTAQANRVLCFDFRTQNNGQLAQMYSFIIQFGSDPLALIFPGNVIRKLDAVR
jgi:hypothetical protein